MKPVRLLEEPNAYEPYTVEDYRMDHDLDAVFLYKNHILAKKPFVDIEPLGSLRLHSDNDPMYDPAYNPRHGEDGLNSQTEEILKITTMNDSIWSTPILFETAYGPMPQIDFSEQ